MQNETQKEIAGLSYSGVKSPTECQQSLFESHFASRQSLSDCPVAFRSEERFSRNAETDLVCRLLLEKKKITRVRHNYYTLCYSTRYPSMHHAKVPFSPLTI